MLLLSGNTKSSLNTSLVVINSRLMNYYYKEFFVTIDVSKNALSSFQYVIDFSNPADVKRHDRMVALVERMLELHKQLAAARLPQEKEMLERQIQPQMIRLTGLCTNYMV